MQCPNTINVSWSGDLGSTCHSLQLTSPKYYLYRIFYKPLVLIKDQIIYPSKGDFLPYSTCPTK